MTEQAKIWHAAALTVPRDYEEVAVSALDALGSLGSEVDLLSDPTSPNCKVTAYFTSPPNREGLLTAFRLAEGAYQLPPLVDLRIVTSTLKERDWLAEWKKYWKPVTIGRFTIAAPWHEVDETAGIAVRIEPNMAFGTGTHETTQLCLESMDRIFRPEWSLLDVGTGTGILAIAAAKAAKASNRNATFSGIDIDPESITIARHNAILNGVEDRIAFSTGTLTPTTPSHDLVFANLTADVIAPMLPLLLEKARRALVLSGILAEQVDDVLAEIPPNCVTTSVRKKGEWVSITIGRPPAE